MRQADTHARAVVAAMGAVLLWSTVASAFKLALMHLTFHALLLVASWTSTVVLACVVLAQGKAAMLRAVSFRQYLRAGLLGLLNPLAYYLVLFRAYSLLPAQEAQPLNYTWPLALVLLSAVVLRQRVSLRTVGSMAVSFAGVVLISTRGDIASFHLSNAEGVALAVGSSVIWASYWLLNIRTDGDPVVMLLATFLFGSVYVSIVTALFGGPLRLPWAGVLGGVYVGVFEMGITFVLWMKALTLARSPATVSHLVYLSPFLSLLVIHIVVGEAILPSTVIGLGLIVTGIALQEFVKRREARVEG
jgi:drug/metabolite transporter (DMT)-like permease